MASRGSPETVKRKELVGKAKPALPQGIFGSRAGRQAPRETLMSSSCISSRNWLTASGRISSILLKSRGRRRVTD